MGLGLPEAVLASAIIGAGATGVSGYMQSRAQKEAAKKAEESARAQRQFSSEQAPDQATNMGQSVIKQNDEKIPGLQGNILANSRKYSAPQAGDKTLLGQ